MLSSEPNAEAQRWEAEKRTALYEIIASIYDFMHGLQRGAGSL